jgi:hypothetical protein
MSDEVTVRSSILDELSAVSTTQVNQHDLVKRANSAYGLLSSIPMVCHGEACQPAGTLIETVSHGKVLIEELNPSLHKLVAFDLGNLMVRKGRPSFGYPGYSFEKRLRDYEGLMITISTQEAEHKCTSDHYSIVRWNEKAINAFVVYLMERDGHFRIGKTKLISQKDDGKRTFYPAQRARAEQADNLWILGVYSTNTEALLMEEFFSVTWQTPKACFFAQPNCSNDEGLYRWVTQEQLDEHHNKLNKPRLHYSILLNSIGKDINYPFWSTFPCRETTYEFGSRRKEFSYLGSLNRVMIVKSCNLVSEYMDVPVIPGVPKIRDYKGKGRTAMRKQSGISPVWKTITTRYTRFSGTVFSLEVEKYKTYIANDIITHNCSYSEVCPIHQAELTSVGDRCPIETDLTRDMFVSYCQELMINPDYDKVQAGLVKDLCSVEIQALRANKLMSFKDFIVDVVDAINPRTGEVIYRKDLHIAILWSEKLINQKIRILDTLAATPIIKVKYQGGIKTETLQDKLLALRKQVEALMPKDETVAEAYQIDEWREE